MTSARPRSKVFDGVLKNYVLPNGHKAHFYFSGKAISDAIDTALSGAPRRPTENGDVRPELPTADVMRELVLPRLDGDSSFRPFPMLPKPPVGHCGGGVPRFTPDV